MHFSEHIPTRRVLEPPAGNGHRGEHGLGTPYARLRGPAMKTNFSQPGIVLDTGDSGGLVDRVNDNVVL